MVQDVMLRCWEEIKKPNSVKSLEAWCMTLTRNKSLDRLKRKGRLSDTLSDHFELSSSSLSPLQQTEESETSNTIMNLIAALPISQKEVITLRDLEGYSYKEIADMMKINLNHVKVLLHRARSTVRTQLTRVNNYGVTQDA